MSETQQTKITDIERARMAAVVFLKKVLDVHDVKIVKMTKTEDGWEVEAEVYEESSFIKSLGLSTKVRDRNIYEVKLDSDLEAQSYERKGRVGISE